MNKLISGAVLCLLAFNVNAALILDQAYAPVVPDNTSPGDVFFMLMEMSKVTCTTMQASKLKLLL